MISQVQDAIQNIPQAIQDGLDQEKYLQVTKNYRPNYLRGFVAGAAAGFIGTAVKSIFELIAPPQQEDVDTPQRQLAQEMDVAGPIGPLSNEITETVINWTFGTLIGGAYGIAVEAAPEIQEDLGATFGTSLYTGGHQAVLPALGLENQSEKPIEQKSSQLVGHILFGLTVELVRRGLRHTMEEREIF